MSTDHHGSNPDWERDNRILEGQGDGPFGRAKELRDMVAKTLGEHPAPRINATDEGALAFAIGVYKGNVVVNFPKPVHWFGMPPDQAIELAELLIKNARAAGSRKPIEIKLG